MQDRTDGDDTVSSAEVTNVLAEATGTDAEAIEEAAADLTIESPAAADRVGE